MARGEPPRPGSQLPAPYRSPWSDLRQALAAVLADQRLALLRLWRRNREGDLPLPGIWPPGLAPLFWPLLLSAALALLLGLGGWLLNVAMSARSTVQASSVGAKPGLLRADEARQGRPDSATSVQEQASSPEAAAAAGNGPLAPQPSSGEQAQPAPASGSEPAGFTMAGSVATATAETAGPQAPELRLDPLLELLSQGEEAELLLAARPDPASSRLSLTLSDAAEVLPQEDLLEQAQRWQQRALDAGYERLELRDRQGRLRGRDALVGSGMILLAPVPGS